jgi:hypothetical protein
MLKNSMNRRGVSRLKENSRLGASGNNSMSPPSGGRNQGTCHNPAVKSASQAVIALKGAYTSESRQALGHWRDFMMVVILRLK